MMDRIAVWLGRVTADVAIVASVLFIIFGDTSGYRTVGYALLAFMIGLGAGYNIGKKSSVSPPQTRTQK